MCRIGEVAQLNTEFMHDGRNYLEFWLPKPCKTMTANNHTRRKEFAEAQNNWVQGQTSMPSGCTSHILAQDKRCEGKDIKHFHNNFQWTTSSLCSIFIQMGQNSDARCWSQKIHTLTLTGPLLVLVQFYWAYQLTQFWNKPLGNAIKHYMKVPGTMITDNHSFSKNWEPENGGERLTNKYDTMINAFKTLSNVSSPRCRHHAQESPLTSELDSQSASQSPDREQSLSEMLEFNAMTNPGALQELPDQEQSQISPWTHCLQELSFRKLVTACLVPEPLMTKLKAWLPPPQKRQPVTMRVGRKCRKMNTRSPSSSKDQAPASQCALATKSAWHCTPTSRHTSTLKKNDYRESVPGSTLKMQRSTGSLMMQGHATMQSTSTSSEGEITAKIEQYAFNENQCSNDNILIKVILNEAGNIENVMQEIISGQPEDRKVSVTPVPVCPNLVTEQCDSLPSLSHDTVSKTLDKIALPHTGPHLSTVGNNFSPARVLQDAVKPGQTLTQLPPVRCGQNFFELLGKKDKSDLLLALLTAPKLFNGQI